MRSGAEGLLSHAAFELTLSLINSESRFWARLMAPLVKIRVSYLSSTRYACLIPD